MFFLAQGKEKSNGCTEEILAAMKEHFNKNETSIRKMLLRLTEEVVALRKEVRDLKMHVKCNTPITCILPAPFTTKEDLMQFERTLEDNEDKFNELVNCCT